MKKRVTDVKATTQIHLTAGLTFWPRLGADELTYFTEELHEALTQAALWQGSDHHRSNVAKSVRYLKKMYRL